MAVPVLYCKGRRMTIKCIECGSPAVWVRSTQFCGDHPYCEKCAKNDDDFGKDDPSYQLWYKVDTDD